MRRLTALLTFLTLAPAGVAVAEEPSATGSVPGYSRLAARDSLGELLWPGLRDAVPRRRHYRQVRPSENRVHLTTGSVEDLADWLGQFGEIETGPGPRR